MHPPVPPVRNFCIPYATRAECKDGSIVITAADGRNFSFPPAKGRAAGRKMTRALNAKLREYSKTRRAGAVWLRVNEKDSCLSAEAGHAI